MPAGRSHSLAARIGRTGSLLAGLAATAAAGLWYQLLRRPLPRTEGPLTVEGIEGPIEIRRDRWGVPHIHASTSADLWFGQGFCQGQDRLWQLELYRRLATGRIAEVAGPSSLPTDRFMRTLGIARVAERELATLEPGLADALNAFCAGVNAAAASSRASPFEFQLLRLGWQPWTPADTLAITKVLAFGLSTNWERELLRADMVRELGAELAARLDPGYPRGNPIVTEPGQPWTGDGLALVEQLDRVRGSLGLTLEATGSNNWAVSGSRSHTGRPLIAGDPHLSPSMPGITYQVGLYLDGRFCRGGCLPGVVGVVFGQNNDVVWTFTNVLADVMDLFVERVSGDDYEFEGEWRSLEVTEEEIPVRGRAEPDRVVVRRTHHGPIINDAVVADKAEPLALRWSALDFPCVTNAWVGVLDISSGPELVELLEHFHTPVSNLVWADRHGSIGYKLIGRLPIRPGNCPDLPKPGWTGEHEWDGWVPYDEQPSLVDPDTAYVVTANNKVTGDDFPHHITSDYLDGYRARRIEHLIEAEAEHSLDSFQGMQVDLRSIPGLETARRLARLHPDRPRGVPMGQREVWAIERLRSWDGRLDPDSVAATIYQAFTLHLGRAVAREAIGDRDLAQRWLDRADNGFLAHVSSPWRWQSHLLALWAEGDEELVGKPWDELVVDALRAALDDLGARYGRDPEAWRWGRVHRLEFPHALGGAGRILSRILNRGVEVGGGQETVAQVGWDPNDPFKAIWAPCWRIVADPVEPDRSRWQAFTGQSGHPGSRHYDDLQPRWARGEMQQLAGEAPWRTLELVPAASSASPPGAAGSAEG